MDEWRDPFADEQTARAREQRRAEREARRRERRATRREQQGAIAERVKGMMGSGGNSGDGAGSIDAGDGDRAATVPRASQGTVPPPQPPAQPPPQPPRKPPAGSMLQPPRPPRGPDDVRRRRLIFGAIVVVVVVGIVAGLAALVSSLGGDGSSSAPPATAGPVTELVIPEGYDRQQIAELVKQEGLEGDYMKASESVKGFDPAKYGAENPSSLEGFLFPATYELPRRPSVDDLIVRQLDAFKQYLNEVDLGYARSKNLTPYDVLIIASLVEREAVVEKDRKLVAAVVYNRLSEGMPLQIDATIRFAQDNWTEPLTESDLQIDSPYNTYANSGLPPTPIGNPGLASIEAAAKPAKVSHLYYVAKPDGCGHFFTDSYEDFQQASEEYDAARAAAGGKAPADCG
jgi:cell division protein YceG involved in septum cleavage